MFIGQQRPRQPNARRTEGKAGGVYAEFGQFAQVTRRQRGGFILPTPYPFGLYAQQPRQIGLRQTQTEPFTRQLVSPAGGERGGVAL